MHKNILATWQLFQVNFITCSRGKIKFYVQFRWFLDVACSSPGKSSERDRVRPVAARQTALELSDLHSAYILRSVLIQRVSGLEQITSID